MSTIIPVSNPYRSIVAQAAAAGGTLPAVSEIALGSGTSEYSLDDTAMASETVRVSAIANVSGTSVTVTAAVTGAQLGGTVVNEIGVFAKDGTLICRKTVQPKTLEDDTELEIEIIFEY